MADIRDLVGAGALARSGEVGGNDPLPPGAPLLLVFLTTGAFDDDSILLLESNGIKGVDGNMLANDLAI